MFLKPKKTNLNPNALVYRRITHLERSRNTLIVYKCIKNNGEYRYFIFDLVDGGFVEIDLSTLTSAPKEMIVVTLTTQIFINGATYWYWNKILESGEGKWVSTDTKPSTITTLANTGFSNTANYQTNEYIFVGSFSYTIKGEVIGALTQQLKGNIMPLTSLNIQYYNDYIDLRVDDLVVINNQLFSVENPNYDVKHMPKDFKIYSVTLNSVL